LEEALPDKVKILAVPNTNGGYLSADLPRNCVKISLPRVLVLSAEQLAARMDCLGQANYSPVEQDNNEEE